MVFDLLLDIYLTSNLNVATGQASTLRESTDINPSVLEIISNSIQFELTFGCMHRRTKFYGMSGNKREFYRDWLPFNKCEG